MAAPFMAIARPMVMMIRFRTVGFRVNPKVIFSEIKPKIRQMMVAEGKTRGMGHPQAVNVEAAIMAPSITNSPWAKLMTSVAL